MKNSILISFILVLISCTGAKHEEKNRTGGCPDDQFVCGHFHDKISVDTFFVRLIDENSGECIPKTLDSVDWEHNIDLLVNRHSTLILSGRKRNIVISGHEQVVGLTLLENLGDLDGDEKDEFGLIWESQDFSSLSRYYVYSLHGNKIGIWFSFPIHESMLEDENPNFIYLENDSIYCREYHPEYDNETDDGSEYYARSRKKHGS